MPYKQGVTGSSPVVPTIQYGPVVQLVRTLACHARGRRFEPDPGRQHFKLSRPLSLKYASVAQLVEQGTENPRVVGSIPTGGTICGCSSSGRAPPCQGGGSEFEPRHPLQKERSTARTPFGIWYHSQVVRQGSAKPRFPSSNLGGTSSIPVSGISGNRVFFYQKNKRFCQKNAKF